jgi:hypothetical protein
MSKYDDARDEFVRALDKLIKDTEQGTSFSGRTQAMRTLRRVNERVALKADRK